MICNKKNYILKYNFFQLIEVLYLNMGSTKNKRFLECYFIFFFKRNLI